jgi:demethylmenaquinone methyltransferase/2-methoxy-6-polyprenyl-1,4-benzoquinol methylase
MFDAIAPRYDLLNRVLSAGIDRRWRRSAIRSLGLTRQTVLLDVCSGTADVPLEARRSGGMGRVIGVDFSRTMLKVGSRKIQRAGLQAGIGLVQADATRLPVRTASVDAVTVAFGIRNVERPDEACREMARTLRSGGRLAILEFGVPRLPGISTLYLWYFRFLLPRVGRFVSGHQGAYAYLPASVTTFPAPEAFCDILATAGFTRVSAVPLSLGIVYLYTAHRA